MIQLEITTTTMIMAKKERRRWFEWKEIKPWRSIKMNETLNRIDKKDLIWINLIIINIDKRQTSTLTMLELQQLMQQEYLLFWCLSQSVNQSFSVIIIAINTHFTCINQPTIHIGYTIFICVWVGSKHSSC